MAKRLVSVRFHDIIESIERIRIVLDGVELDVFEGNWQKQWIVERGMLVISEASRHLPPTAKERNAHIPWSKIAGIGNVLRHEYDRTAAEILWTIARDDLSILDNVCRAEVVIAEAEEAN